MRETACPVVDVQLPGMKGPELQDRFDRRWLSHPDHFRDRVFRREDPRSGVAGRRHRLSDEAMVRAKLEALPRKGLRRRAAAIRAQPRRRMIARGPRVSGA
jgi:hypothetical protein